MDYLIYLLSEGVISLPDGISSTEYEHFAQFFYQRVYQEMTFIDSSLYSYLNAAVQN